MTFESGGESSSKMNRKVILNSRSTGIPQAHNFEIIDSKVPSISQGELLVRNHFISIEPAMRGWVSDIGNYSSPVAVGAVMRSLASGEIVQSRHPDFRAGQFVTGWFGWQEFSAVKSSDIVQRTTREEMTHALGIFGINGITAYFALIDVGCPNPGETVVISTAAGAVGSIVGQIAKILGCRAIGITGSADKAAACIANYGYDAAIVYREEDVGARIAELCPAGVDIYFDNTSGAISDAVLPNLAVKGRVVVCGTASISRWDDWPIGPRVERHLLVKRARMEGFLYFDYVHRMEEAIAQLRTWLSDGQLNYQEDILDGIEQCPDAIAGLYRGENRGKRLIRLV
jgi:NADPH-dependent curcumin reductase CurA